MEFHQTLLAAQRNQQEKSSGNGSSYYKAKFDPPKKENKPKDKLSANIQKFLAKKEEEERQKKIETLKKRDELLAMRDPKAIRKIQKSLKVFKSANKSVLADAIDYEHTAVTREGPQQPDQDDYGYESQEAAAIYKKMMEKYSKIPDEPKFPSTSSKSKKDLEGTKERVKNALQHEDDPVVRKRKKRHGTEDHEPSPPSKFDSEKKKDEKPKMRKPMPPPMDFNQLLKLAEQKKCEPVDIKTTAKKPEKSEPEPERLMTKKQKREYEEEMARRIRRQERLECERSGKKAPSRDGQNDLPTEVKKTEPSSFGRIPKLGDKSSISVKSENKSSNKDKIQSEMEKIEKLQREKAKLDKEKVVRDKERMDLERLEKLKAEREKIERDIEKLNKDREKLEKAKMKLEANQTTKTSEKSKISDLKKNIDLKSQNTYRIDKITNEKKGPINRTSDSRATNGHSTGKSLPPSNKIPLKKSNSSRESPKLNNYKYEKVPDKTIKDKDEKRPGMVNGTKPGPAPKQKISNSFDFDKHVSSLKADGSRKFPPGDIKRKPHPNDLKRKQMQKRRVLDSEDEYDSEMDDFIDDGEEETDYSTHIKEIFGYDKSRYRDMDDEDDPTMESSFSRQMREEFISKKIGIMEDLEDIKLEKKMKKKKRRISDD